MKKTRLRDSAWLGHVMWEEATVSAFLHNCSSPPRFPPQAGDGGVRGMYMYVVCSLSGVYMYRHLVSYRGVYMYKHISKIDKMPQHGL